MEEQGPTFERDRLELSLTKSKIHKAVLSEKARAMCGDKEAYWAIPNCPSGISFYLKNKHFDMTVGDLK